MTNLLNNPVFLLLMTGALLGFNFPLGKLAGQAEISPFVWAMVISLGGVLLLFPILALQKKIRIPRGREIRYVLISAVISYVLPNILLFSALPHTGAGFSGFMFALSPIFTLAFSLLVWRKPVAFQSLVGLSFGLVGAIIISASRSLSDDGPSTFWIIMALLVPFCLAIGNVYRTLDWPPESESDFLAFWSHCFAVLIFLITLPFAGSITQILDVSQSPEITLLQLLVAGVTFPLFFRLQKQGGPVL